MSVYTVDLSYYKDTKIEFALSNNVELMMMAKEMIYYNHLSNIIMYNFLSSNESIEYAINNTKIISLDDYLDGNGGLFS